MHFTNKCAASRGSLLFFWQENNRPSLHWEHSKNMNLGGLALRWLKRISMGCLLINPPHEMYYFYPVEWREKKSDTAPRAAFEFFGCGPCREGTDAMCAYIAFALKKRGRGCTFSALHCTAVHCTLECVCVFCRAKGSWTHAFSTNDVYLAPHHQ